MKDSESSVISKVIEDFFQFYFIKLIIPMG